MKKITFLLSFIACVLVAQAQTLLVENFDYTIGSAITAQGWAKHSGTVTPNDSILVTAGLTFAGYPGSGVGGAANLVGSNKDQNKTFASQTTGNVYVSFMMKAAAVNRPGYFFHLSPSPVTNTFFSRVWINGTGSGMAIGPVASSVVEPATYTPIVADQTYLIVVKIDLTTKVSSLFVFSTLPTIEPTTAQMTYTETAATSVGGVGLRQYSFSGSTTNQNIIVDGIRVATSWAALFTTTGFSTPSANNLEVSLIGKKLTVTDSSTSSVEIFSAVGSKIQTVELVNGSANLNLSKGLYIVRVGKKAAKIMMNF
ncbi:MAG: hypothetical protein GZ091_11605 [Paludibacter sp.]|nr:hypothetical protein [Paludibacter sp.]